MYIDDKILVGKGEDYVYLLPKMANRHGLIAGATGTGKTITLKVLAESFSDMGVPVFLADIKGDVSGMCKPGVNNEHIAKRLQTLGLSDFNFKSYPTEFWDVFGESGLPIRTTISEMGPEMLGRLMNLTDIQKGVLNIVFRIADDNGMLLIDIRDLRAMLAFVGKHNKDYTINYGNVSSQSIGAIQRALLSLEDEGGNLFFGEPELSIDDWLRHDDNGKGVINILHCVKLFNKPTLYSTFMLWMLTELYENLPEVGDLPQPKVVFFFDEAHVLFKNTGKALVEKIEQVIKLIRSKGVGVYFVTQNPGDIPDSVLAQLGNRVQHALRAYTPSDQKAVRTAAQSFRTNPAFNTEDVISELGTGEALVSFLDEKGRPSIVQRTLVLPPMSNMDIIDNERRNIIIESSVLNEKYRNAIDRKSAYETINEQKEAENKKLEMARQYELEEQTTSFPTSPNNDRHYQYPDYRSTTSRSTRSTRKSPSLFDSVAKSAMNTIGRELGRNLVRSLLGILKK